MAEGKEKTLEMRVAELEDKLSKVHITEEEMKAYQRFPQFSVVAAEEYLRELDAFSIALEAASMNAIRACTIRACTIRACCIIRACTYECGGNCDPGAGGGGGLIGGGGFGGFGG